MIFVVALVLEYFLVVNITENQDNDTTLTLLLYSYICVLFVRIALLLVLSSVKYII